MDATRGLYFPEDDSGKRRLDKVGPERNLLRTHLAQYGRDFGLDSPVRKWSYKGVAPRVLSTSNTRKTVHEAYTASYDKSNVGASEYLNDVCIAKLTGPFAYNTFCKHWRYDASNLRLSTSWIDYCDKCTEAKRCISLLTSIGDREADKDLTVQRLDRHRAESPIDFKKYKDMQ